LSFGYAGRILWIDLSAGEIREESPDATFYRSYVGGRGIGALTLLRGQPARVDPLGPDNILGFTAGLMVGFVPGATRCSVVAKSPLTRSWGDASIGGPLATKLKMAGFDAVFIKGASPKPVLLKIIEGRATLHDAGSLWGKDARETIETLAAETEGSHPGIAAIGPAGENLSRISSIITSQGVAGRGGFGAVMGSKRLKALVVQGSVKPVAAQPERAAALRQAIVKELSTTTMMPLAKFRGAGTCATFESNVVSGGAPIKNWQHAGGEVFPSYKNLNGDKVLAFRTRKESCPGCPVACKGKIRNDQGPHAVGEMEKPEYESLNAFGPLCLVDDLEGVMKAIDLCNRYGMDTISTGTTIAFAMECFEHGLIDEKDTGGMALTWGDLGATLALIEQMALRKGFGAVLADGTSEAAERIGKGSERYAVTVHGRELPMHNPRQFPGTAHVVAYSCEPNPANHIPSKGIGNVELGKDLGPYPEFRGIKAEMDDFEAKVKIYHRGHSWFHFVEACGLCSFVMNSGMPVVDLVQAITGWDVTAGELLLAGERIQALRQLFNCREGIRPEDFNLPRRIVDPPATGPGKDKRYPIDEIRQAYFKAMRWDPVSGEPEPERLRELGLSDSMLNSDASGRTTREKGSP
jgi:aldehyde:ferredoxin oxidoreductase